MLPPSSIAFCISGGTLMVAFSNLLNPLIGGIFFLGGILSVYYNVQVKTCLSHIKRVKDKNSPVHHLTNSPVR
jgi:hypothetical protein